MKKYFSMMVVFAAFLSMLFSATAFADWGNKGKEAEHKAKGDYYEAKGDAKDDADDVRDNVRDAADDASDNLKDAGEDVKNSFKKATN